MSNISPFFSIIVPVYNVQKYINECLDSILCQSYKNLEIILVDDGSPDSCPAICDEYAAKDSRIKVIHQANQGLSQARNAGIKASTGDYLLFVDSDDMLASGEVLKELSDFLQKSDNPITFCSDSFRVEENQTEADFTLDQKTSCDVREEQLFAPDELFAFSKNKRGFLASWTFIIRRDFFIAHSLYFLPNLLYEDMEWFPRLLFAKPDLKVRLFTRPYYLYRNNPASITHTFGQPHFESLIKIIAFYNSHLEAQPQNLFIKNMLNAALYAIFVNLEIPCLANSDFYKSNLPTIKSLFRQNYHLLIPRNKILYLFILFSPKAFFVLRKWIKKARRD